MKEYHIIKVYGIDLLVVISSVKALATGICLIILTVFTYIIESTFENKDFTYLIIFPLFGVFNFLDVILGFFEDDEPFN